GAQAVPASTDPATAGDPPRLSGRLLRAPRDRTPRNPRLVRATAPPVPFPRHVAPGLTGSRPLADLPFRRGPDRVHAGSPREVRRRGSLPLGRGRRHRHLRG